MVIQYKCPNCGADMNFDSESGHLSCDSCGHQDNIEDFKEELIIKTYDSEEAVEYQCENCGAEVITEPDTTATQCSFCDAAVVLADRVSGVLAPKMVIPFTISKEEAMKAFKVWCKNGRFSPKEFMNANRVKNITGMYVPFWMYDVNSDIALKATGNKVRTYRRGDYVYTETSIFEVERHFDLYYQNVPVDASEKLSDSIMDKIEPYNYEELKEFKTPYLAGFFAEKYNYDHEELYPRVEKKIQGYIDDYVESTLTGYTSITNRHDNRKVKNKDSQYVLFPIWMVYYDFDQQEHTFAMNGQTGKVVGKAPISKLKVAKWVGGLTLSVFGILKVAAGLVGGIWL